MLTLKFYCRGRVCVFVCVCVCVCERDSVCVVVGYVCAVAENVEMT